MSTALKPILFVLTSQATKGASGEPTGYYLSEVTHPLAELDEAGLTVEFASIAGGEPPVDGMDLTDPINARYWNDDTFRAAVRQTRQLAEVDASRYGGVFFAGGHGTMWDFPDSPVVQLVAREIYEAGGLIGAVCHGPSALVNVKLSSGRYLVDGKRVAAFTDDEERAVKLESVVPFMLASRLQQRGARHQPAPNWHSQVAIDGRLITGQNPQSATAVGAAMREALTAVTQT